MDDIDAVLAFFEARRGRMHGFRWKDWTDFQTGRPSREVGFEDEIIAVGDEVSVGESQLRVSAVLTYRPDQSIGFASLAPSLLVNLGDLPTTGLISEGSRVE